MDILGKKNHFHNGQKKGRYLKIRHGERVCLICKRQESDILIWTIKFVHERRDEMKEKIAKIIRTITIPPIEVLVMLLILYRVKGVEFGDKENLMMAVLFLTVIPICSYPLASRKKKKEDNRNAQRNMAFVFNFFSYLAAMLIGYYMSCPKMLQWILNDYFLSVMLLTIINKVFKKRASGHACSCTYPYLVLSYYFGGAVAFICLFLYLAECWASIELKRHTIKEFLEGTLVAWLVFAGTVWLL